jgi:thiol-disulfide isomerase/thioredoxin
MVVSSLAFMGCTSSDTPDTQADNQPTYKSKSSKSNHDDVASQEGTQTAPERRMMPAVPMKTSPSKSSQDMARQTQGANLVAPSGGSPGTADQDDVLLLEVGAPAPDFVTIDLAGNPVKLSDWRAKVVILDFWATWCGLCIASFPQTQDLAAQVKDQDVVVMAVCTSDSRVAYEKFVNKNGERYPDLILTCDPPRAGL